MVVHSSILARKSYGQRSLAGYSPQGRKESDITEHAHPINQVEKKGEKKAMFQMGLVSKRRLSF